MSAAALKSANQGRRFAIYHLTSLIWHCIHCINGCMNQKSYGCISRLQRIHLASGDVSQWQMRNVK